jgi:hypothetical protein
MKRICSVIAVLALMFSLHTKADGSAIKLEYGGTSMTVILSEKPKIVMEDGNIVLKTISTSVVLSLPCKATYIDNAEDNPNGIANIRNDGNKPIDVFTIEGKKIATLKNNEVKNLQRGIYVINGKKILIK